LAPAPAEPSAQDGVPPGEPVQHPGGAVPRKGDGRLPAERGLDLEHGDLRHHQRDGGGAQGCHPSTKEAAQWEPELPGGDAGADRAGDVREELRPPLPRAGGQPGLRRQRPGQGHLPQEQPPRHRAGQGAGSHPDAFRSSPDLTGVVHTYEELKRKGVEFPTADLDALSPIHTPQRSVPEVDPAATVPRPQAQPKTSSSPYSAPPASYSAPQAPALSATGPITANSEQIARLRSELAVVRGNTKVLSEMLTEMVPGQEAASDLELLQELHRTCRAMQQRVVELVSRVSNEEVTEELLRVNDDLNNVFLRYERFERYRSGRSVQNASNGVLSDVTEDNLIDLGPGSPAVVSPTVGGVAPPSSLSSQLAGLDLGTESVSGALSSLQQCDPRDSFDMFAQTRGSNSEPRKTATLEDPPATGVLSSALDGQKPGSEVKGDDLEEGVTSEEFDKFLEERAKAAEMVPSLPSPPAEAPASNPSGRKKPERSEDALFAL
uniref:Target of myb1 like 2 membrane trafficking protein n=1 Tax=Sus scrofa TaxID=9823 RepID=A0A8D1B8Q9_PIG